MQLPGLLGLCRTSSSSSLVQCMLGLLGDLLSFSHNKRRLEHLGEEDDCLEQKKNSLALHHHDMVTWVIFRGSASDKSRSCCLLPSTDTSSSVQGRKWCFTEQNVTFYLQKDLRVFKNTPFSMKAWNDALWCHNCSCCFFFYKTKCVRSSKRNLLE